MSQTAVKESICDICGADIRDGSVFCYNCGSAISEKPVEPDESQSSDAHSNGNAVVTDGDKILPKPMLSGRARTRKRPVQNREVVWQEREGISVGFIAMTVALVLLSAAILIAGFYYR